MRVFSPRLPPALSLAVAAVLILSLFVTAPGNGGLFVPPWNRVVHFGFYGCIALLLAYGLGKDRLGVAFILAVTTGVADECYQSLLPTRHASWGDLLTDVIAAACAVLLARHLLSRASPEAPVAGVHDPDAQQQVGQGMGENRRP